MTKTDWTAEEVRAIAKDVVESISCVDPLFKARDILLAFADSIEADEMAVPVAQVSQGGMDLLLDGTDAQCWPADPMMRDHIPLFTRPPAQTAQEHPGWKVPDNERDSERLDWIESTMREYGDGCNEPLTYSIGWTGWLQSKYREPFPGLRKALDAAMADEWNNQKGPTFMGEPVLPKPHTWAHSSKLGGDYCEICGVMKGMRRSARACTPRPEFDGTSDPFKPEFDGTTPPKEY